MDEEKKMEVEERRRSSEGSREESSHRSRTTLLIEKRLRKQEQLQFHSNHFHLKHYLQQHLHTEEEVTIVE